MKSIERALVGRAVDARIGQLHPRRQMLLERGERVEAEPGEGIAFEIFDARLDFAFGAGPIRRARPRLRVPVATEGQVGRMEPDGAGGAIAIDDERARIVPEDGPRHAPEVPERRGDALAPLVLTLREKRLPEQPAGVAEDRRAQED